MKQSIILLITSLVTSCSTIQEYGWFEDSAKKLEGKRINAFSEDNISESSILELPNKKLLELNAIVSYRMPVSNTEVYFNDKFGYFRANNKLMKLDFDSVKTQEIYTISSNLLGHNIVLIDDEDVVFSNKTEIASYSFYNHKLQSIHTEIPVKSKVKRVASDIKCFQDISYNLKCFDNSGVFTIAFEDVASEATAKNLAGIAALGNTVFFSTKDGILRAVDINSKNMLWEYNSAYKFDLLGQSFYNLSFGPKIIGKNLFFANYANGIYAIDLESGREIFKHPVREVNNIIAVDNFVLASSSNNKLLIADTLQNKSLMINPNMPKNEFIKFMYPHFGKVIIVTNQGKFLSLDLKSDNGYNATNLVLDVKQEIKQVHDLQTKVILVLKNKLLIINKL